MSEQKVPERPDVPPPPPRQPDEELKGYIERGNVSRPAVRKEAAEPR